MVQTKLGFEKRVPPPTALGVTDREQEDKIGDEVAAATAIKICTDTCCLEDGRPTQPIVPKKDTAQICHKKEQPKLVY